MATLSSVQPAHVDQTGRARFPALDPEPPPRPWWRRLLVPAGVIAVAAVVAVSVADWPALTGRAHRSASAPRPTGVVASGRILAETATGGLVVAGPDGGKAVALTALGQFPPSLRAAPDSRYVWLGDGQTLSLASLRHPAVTQTKAKFSASTQAPLLNPFAGHDRYAVLLDSFHGAPQAIARITVNSLATGKAAALGNGHFAAGDPQTVGAFVTVAGAPRPSSAGNQVIPDARLELRQAGHAPVTLATAAGLNHGLGASRRRQVALIPFPSPSGNQVAVEVQTATANTTAEIVVLSREGKVLDTPAAPGLPVRLAWSPDGTSLAYVTLGTTGLGLTRWTVGGGAITMSFPFTGARYGTCVWSPDGASILCSDRAGRHWAIAHATGGQMIPVRGRGVPIAWVR
ncbi:MAG TPA: hypothetical protein VIV12_19505 [Streptosporangiaceae bacterium]